MIRISIGGVGSGKTLTEVKTILEHPLKRLTYTNIKIPNCKHTVLFKPEMILKRIKKNNKDSFTFNKEFWVNIKEPINVVIDEAHSFYESRRSMSVSNLVMNQFVASIRRILGTSAHTKGELVLITQLPERLDKYARELARQIRLHICTWKVTCISCNAQLIDNSQNAEPHEICPRCRSTHIKLSDYNITMLKFKSFDDYLKYKEYGKKTYYRKAFLLHAEQYFKHYDSLQWDDLFEDY